MASGGSHGTGAVRRFARASHDRGTACVPLAGVGRRLWCGDQTSDDYRTASTSGPMVLSRWYCRRSLLSVSPMTCDSARFDAGSAGRRILVSRLDAQRPVHSDCRIRYETDHQQGSPGRPAVEIEQNRHVIGDTDSRLRGSTSATEPWVPLCGRGAVVVARVDRHTIGGDPLRRGNACSAAVIANARANPSNSARSVRSSGCHWTATIQPSFVFAGSAPSITPSSATRPP